LRVTRRDVIRTMRSDNRQMRHANLSLRSLFNQAHPCDTTFVAGKARTNLVEETTIDLENNLQLTRKHHLEPGEWPLFQGLRKQSVVRVAKGPAAQVPCLCP